MIMMTIEFKVHVHCTGCPKQIERRMTALDDNFGFDDGYNIDYPDTQVGSATITFDVEMEDAAELKQAIKEKFEHAEWQFSACNPEGIVINCNDVNSLGL